MIPGWTWLSIADSVALDTLIRVLNTRLNALSGVVTQLIGVTGGIVTPASGTTAPVVTNATIVQTANATATTITTFQAGVPGQRITLWSTDANTTVQHSTSASGIRLKGSTNVTLTATETREFATVDGVSWREL